MNCLTGADCADGNPCTDEVCTDGVCSNPDNTASCDDELFCTLTDVCSGGTCTGNGTPCTPPQLCDETLKQLVTPE